MSRFERFRGRILPPAHVRLLVLLLVALLLLAACSVRLPSTGASASPTAMPSPATATSVPITPPQTAATLAPTGAPPTVPEVTVDPTQPAQTQTGTPATQTPTSTLTPTRPSGLVVNGTGNSNAEQAHLRLQSQSGPGDPVYLVIVSSQSAGVEGAIYRDLRQRYFRTTTGPDEGIDTGGEFCYPDCVFVLSEEVNAISIGSYMRVLQHEYRHITQAKNNPSMARDFRDPDGIFTPYAAFSEACADYGLNVAPIYRAQQRIDRLKNVLGPDWQGLLDQACGGDKAAYQDLADQYNQDLAQNNAFQELFPPYR